MLDREFETQSVDPMFLEPECGLAWYDTGAQEPRARARRAVALRGRGSRSRICSATPALRSSRRASTPSSPIWAAASADATIRRSRSMSRWRRCSFPAVRCGWRTTAISSFRRGIKRHAFKMRTRIGVDRATGKISAFAADHVLDGGGLANFSANVATVGATAAIGIYDIPKVDVTTVALHSRGVTAGSMRGYGTLQTMTALEVLIDEAAAALPLDPIEFRRRNALKTGGRTMTGNPYSVSVRTPEILDKLEKHPIWQQRAEEKARGSKQGMLVGTGVACVTKDYGSGADCSLGAVEIDPDGRIAIHGDHVEMGNGIGTALANRVAAHLGGVADEVTVARRRQPMTRSRWSPQAIPTRWTRRRRTPRRKIRAGCRRSARRPVASIGAHVGTQAAAEAARVIFRFGLWPAALELWGIAPTDPTAKQWEAARWKDGQLHHAGSWRRWRCRRSPPKRMRAIS